jgi:hypothetical protein
MIYNCNIYADEKRHWQLFEVFYIFIFMPERFELFYGLNSGFISH